MVRKIVRKWTVGTFEYGIDTRGTLFLQCKKCVQLMTQLDINYSRGRKRIKYGCSKCSITKVVTI